MTPLLKERGGRAQRGRGEFTTKRKLYSLNDDVAFLLKNLCASTSTAFRILLRSYIALTEVIDRAQIQFELCIMKKLLIFIVALSIWACHEGRVKTPAPSPEDEATTPVENVATTAESAIPLTNPCGEDEVDPTTGEPIPKIDLVISHVEVKRTVTKVLVTPVVKNLCKDPVNVLFDVTVFPEGDNAAGNTIRMGDIPGLGERKGGTVAVKPAASYVLMIDAANEVRESDRTNNRCQVAETGRCR